MWVELWPEMDNHDENEEKKEDENFAIASCSSDEFFSSIYRDTREFTLKIEDSLVVAFIQEKEREDQFRAVWELSNQRRGSKWSPKCWKSFRSWSEI